MTIEELNSHFAKPVLSAGVLRVLVACEESQAVTKELRKLGHEAFSCDLLPESGGHPEWHLQQDVTELLKLKWDMIIAFPPCTYLTNAGMCNLTRKGATDEYRANRLRLRDEAMEFAQMIYNNDCPLIAIENPVGYLNTGWRKPDQIIKPYERAHIVNSPRREDRRVAALLCSRCHAVQHGLKFDKSLMVESPTLAELIWLKKKHDPKYYDREFMQANCLTVLPRADRPRNVERLR